MDKATLHATLLQHKKSWHNISLRRLFEEDQQRGERFSLSVGGLYLDYSKNHLSRETLTYLKTFADERQLVDNIIALFDGKLVNNTEKRAALHSALRAPQYHDHEIDMCVKAALSKMEHAVNRLHEQQWLGHTGKPISDVINIGIGGSDLGPRMVVEALRTEHKATISVHFVANIDGADLLDTLANCNPETTLFVVSSKSFSTLETLQNAQSARQWMLDHHCNHTDLNKHFIAVSSNIAAAQDFGIHTDNIFPLWDWVGGRYSLWSAIGLPIAIAIGMDNFNQLRTGAHEMDNHFASAAPLNNMPVLLALITYWYSQYWQVTSQAVLPYAQRLNRLPAYLQQLDMESLGKSITRHAEPVQHSTGIVLWGTEGTNGQHSFHQLLHQGTQVIPTDFIAIKEPMSKLDEQHTHLLACCISQTQALLKGKTQADAKAELLAQGMSEDEANMLAPHKIVPGNRPSNTLVMDGLTPKNLGALIALYEHKVYSLGVLFDINPFDQWGVELGKQLGGPIHRALTGAEVDSRWDSSTKALIKKLQA